MEIQVARDPRELSRWAVQAIVCSANNWLKLGTGIAGQILAHGGPEIQAECDVIIARNGGKPLAIGSAVLTSSGRLASPNGLRRYIIHAVAMGYREKLGTTVRSRILATPGSVVDAVRGSIVLALEYRISSLAFPLMCARPGYSIVSDIDAPRIMLESMLRAASEVSRACHNAPTRVQIYVPHARLLRVAQRLLMQTEH